MPVRDTISHLLVLLVLVLVLGNLGAEACQFALNGLQLLISTSISQLLVFSIG